MSIKKSIIMSLLTVGVSLPLVAQATLTISNKTKHDSTSRINHNVLCSNVAIPPQLGGGITKAGETKVYQDFIIQKACAGHTEDCEALVYMTDHCGGDNDVISKVMFSVTRGVLSATPAKNGYKIVIEGPFSIRMEGGPN